MEITSHSRVEAESFDALHQWLGIPPDEQPPNYYRLLGLSPFENDPNVIAHAADRQMAHVRTFQQGPRGKESQVVLNALAQARVCLLQPEKKARYDERLRARPSDRSLAVSPPLPVDLDVLPLDEPERFSPSRQMGKKMRFPTLAVSGGILAAVAAIGGLLSATCKPKDAHERRPAASARDPKPALPVNGVPTAKPSLFTPQTQPMPPLPGLHDVVPGTSTFQGEEARKTEDPPAVESGFETPVPPMPVPEDDDDPPPLDVE